MNGRKISASKERNSSKRPLLIYEIFSKKLPGGWLSRKQDNERS
jgi:hypothetical protein